MTATLSEPVVIAQRDLRNNSGDILRRTQAGETFVVTNRGEKVAILAPIGGVARPREQRTPVRPARRRGGWDKLRMTEGGATLQEDIDYLRGEQ